MDPFRNGTDKKRFRTHNFVFFLARNSVPFCYALFLSRGTRPVNRRTVSPVFLSVRYIPSVALLWRIARIVKREFRVVFFRRNQKSACKPASMIVGDTHSPLYVKAHMNN